MTVYLNQKEILYLQNDIIFEMNKFLNNRRFVMKPKSKQWQFLKHTLDITINGNSCDFKCDKNKVAQYKYEIEDRLKRYYLHYGKSVRFVFRLIHQTQIFHHEEVDMDYPNSNGYLLLITDDTLSYFHPSKKNTKELVERVVTESIDRHWGVFLALPEIKMELLDHVYYRNGPAYKIIENIAKRHHEKKWTINYPKYNPSTRRLLNIKVDELNTDEAKIRTREYWYLRWWSLIEGKYMYIYKETNTQIYILKYLNNQWLVWDNIYPPPRNTAPNRNYPVS